MIDNYGELRTESEPLSFRAVPKAKPRSGLVEESPAAMHQASLQSEVPLSQGGKRVSAGGSCAVLSYQTAPCQKTRRRNPPTPSASTPLGKGVCKLRVHRHRQCRQLKDCISLIPAMNCGDGATRASLPTVINQTFLFDCRERRPRRSCKSPCDLLKLTTPNRGPRGPGTAVPCLLLRMSFEPPPIFTA